MWKVGEVGMSEFIMKASTDEQAEFCRRYSNMKELVRCKDCKFGFSEYGYVFCTKPYVEKGSANHKPDWFCADGERRAIT